MKKQINIENLEEELKDIECRIYIEEIKKFEIIQKLLLAGKKVSEEDLKWFMERLPKAH